MNTPSNPPLKSLINIAGTLYLETDGAYRPLGDARTVLNELLSATGVSMATALTALEGRAGEKVSVPVGEIRAPIGDQEVWASGVTYKRSEEARERESNNSMIYTRVYSAARPELFFKASGAEVVGMDAGAGIRADSLWSVPEPELVVVLNADLHVVGFTIGNDMSSRDIEGENPLYLPQAKVYQNACVIGPRIVLAPDASAFPAMDIQIQIVRDGAAVFEGKTGTDQVHRTLSELVDYLGRAKQFRQGVYLFTGTGIVPPDAFRLEANDVVTITIEPIGMLRNTVIMVGR